jgi:hypothetical protein
VDPPEPTVDPPARLVEMRHLGVDQLRAELLKELLQTLRALGDERLQRRDRDRHASPVGEDLGRTLVGQVLIGDQVDPQRPDPRAIADRRRHSGREARARQMAALTAALLDPMLNTLQRRHLWQVEHLPRLGLLDRRLRHVPAAALADLHRMQQHPIGILTTLEMTTRMSRLTARLTTRPPPQAPLLVRLGRLLGVPIRGRRLGGVARVLIKPRPQLGDHRVALRQARLQLNDPCLQNLDHRSAPTSISPRPGPLHRRKCNRHDRKIPCTPPRSSPHRPQAIKPTSAPRPE